MSEEPLYAKIVAGFENNERGADALALAELFSRTVSGQVERHHVDHGSPAKELHDLAERGEADLIVLGSTHRAGLGRVAPGSVAERLLTGARCRVAIAPSGYASKEPAREWLRVIGVGFNGTRESEVALGEAADLATRAAASMRVIAVSPPPLPTLGAVASETPVMSGDLQSKLHDAVAELPSELRALPVHVKGDPGARLIERAEEGVDLLVLGSRGFGPVMRLMIGGVVARVVREAPCPVLVVPRPAD